MTVANSSPAADPGRTKVLQLEMDAILGYILLIGVLISLFMIVVGLTWTYVRTGRLWPSYEFSGMNLFQFAVAQIHMAAQREIRPRLFVNGGIVVLLLTPYFRVLASMVYFMAVLKNWKYSLFTGFVLIVLTLSLFLR